MQGVVAAGFPTLLSTRVGLSAGLSVVNAVLPAKVEIAALDLGWHQPLSLQGLKLYNKPEHGSELLAEVDRITTTAGLWQAISGVDEGLGSEPGFRCGD